MVVRGEGTLQLELTSAQQELLKWVAVATMTLDHANRSLWPYQGWAFAVGRLAFPLFVFLLAFNTTVRMVPLRRYVLPLLVFGVLSQPPVFVFFERGWLPLNILFTMLLGVTFLGVVRVLRQRFPKLLAWSVAVIIWAGLGVFVEYGPTGVFLVPATQSLLTRFTLPRAALVVGLLLAANFLTPASFVPLLLPFFVWGVTRMPVARLWRSRWVFYAFYPLHLVLLWMLGRVSV